MNKEVLKYEGKAILKIGSTQTICQFKVTNTQLIITNKEQNEKDVPSLEINIQFIKMEYSIRWVIKNHLISEMILTSKVRRYQFFSIENSLHQLKPFLNGQIAYRGFASFYTVEEQIKQMRGGQVLKVINKFTKQVEVAKQIYIGPNYGQIHSKIVYNEIALAQYFSVFPHKNLLKLLALFVEECSVILIFEHIEVTSLYKLLDQFPEGLPLETLKKFMKTTLKAIKHMHQHKIMHRDIKMDNILMRNINDPKSIVIIDYGFASPVELENLIISRCGTPGYIAPEVLDNERYNELCDIYSVAQVFQKLIDGISDDRILEKDEFSSFSDLLVQMNQDYEFRPSAQECLDHDLFTESKIVNKIRRYSQINQFKHPSSTQIN